MSDFRADFLAGQVALVTGGATGIGQVIARELGRHGARVCIASRSEERLRAAVAGLAGQGVDAAYQVCDVRDPVGVEAAIDGALARWGRLDIVVNNAAGNFPAPIDQISYNGFKTIIDIDLIGAYNVSKAAFSRYLKANGGRIVNISAPFQQQGVALQAHVAAAKAGLDSLTRSCAVEFGPYGIRVNAVAPGATADTEGLARFQAAATSTRHQCPLGTVGAREDVAGAVLFLVSAAADYVSGQVLCVDGAAGVDMLKLDLPRH